MASPDARGAGPGYDLIGSVYARHRRPDPRVAGQIGRALGDAATVVNVGAGTGSYEPVGRTVVAVEPSGVMIGQRPPGSPPVVQAIAEDLPFPDDAFDAAMAILTIHHWTDAAAGLAEMARVARRVVVFTFDPTVHKSFWLLRDYVPEANALPSTNSIGPDTVAEVIGADRIEVVTVPADCVDGFNWAYWRRPRAYLDPDVRACISGLALLDDDLVVRRMERLRADLDDGSWMRRHGHLLGLESIDGGFRLVVRD
ncbi:MAG TPA: class I SAM-dependent methyltransferase [Acidimicrobiales bacterium]|nr:class I SAM-dependent methyltransferase [Acidimicrobiales bacterium]